MFVTASEMNDLYQEALSSAFDRIHWQAREKVTEATELAISRLEDSASIDVPNQWHERLPGSDTTVRDAIVKDLVEQGYRILHLTRGAITFTWIPKESGDAIAAQDDAEKHERYEAFSKQIVATHPPKNSP